MPGCKGTFSLDLEKKSVPRACANTLGGYKETVLVHKDGGNSEVFKVMTGCRNQPKRGEIYCDQRLLHFGVDFAVEDSNSSFLEALYPLGNLQKRRVPRRGDTAPRKDPGPEWILVKQYGQTYKY